MNSHRPSHCTVYWAILGKAKSLKPHNGLNPVICCPAFCVQPSEKLGLIIGTSHPGVGRGMIGSSSTAGSLPAHATDAIKKSGKKSALNFMSSPEFGRENTPKDIV